MKNIESILSEAGIELTDEQRETVKKAVAENYRTIADYQKQADKVKTLEETVSEVRGELAKFDGVDVGDLQAQIKKLEGELTTKDETYQRQIADRDYDDMLSGLINERKGKNAKAIKALLDIDTLKASKNQRDDTVKALDALVEAEDSKMLFGEVETVIGGGNPIGTVKKGGSSDDLDAMRAVMGLSQPKKE